MARLITYLSFVRFSHSVFALPFALTGALLAWLVHPGWLALPAFVGSGLVFAGITDTCGMGMLIARMPWNQVSVEQPAAQCATPKTTAPRDGKS